MALVAQVPGVEPLLRGQWVRLEQLEQLPILRRLITVAFLTSQVLYLVLLLRLAASRVRGVVVAVRAAQVLVLVTLEVAEEAVGVERRVAIYLSQPIL